MKRISIIFATLLFSVATHAQVNEHSNYVGLNLGGGMNTLSYKPADGDWSPKLGFLAEVKYIHFFGEHFGLGLGFQFNKVNSAAEFNYKQVTNGLTHPSNGLTYDATVGFNNWKERQGVPVLGVPIELYWRTALADRWHFLIGLGAQLDFPMKGSYTADEGNYEVSGYFPSTGVTYTNLPAQGFDTYKADESGDVELKKFGVSIIADLGLNYALTNNWGLYFGIYGGYGLTNLIDKADKPMIDAPNGAMGTPVVNSYNGVLNSNQVDKAHLLNLGLKVGVNLGWNCHSDKNAGDNGEKASLVGYDNDGTSYGNQTYGNDGFGNDDVEAEAADKEARCNTKRMNLPELKEALENIDNDLEEAGQMAAEADNADAKAAVKDAKAKAVDAKNAYKKGQYCKAYDQFNEAYALIADSYADDAKMYADGANSDAASQAAEDADLYAEAAHNDGLDCAMAAGRNARINSEIARDADKKAKKDRAAYNDPKFANTLAQEALTMAGKSRSNAAKTDAKDASGKAYRGNCADSYAAAAKSFAESADAFAAKSKNNPEAKAAAVEANRYAQEAAEAARMGDVIAAYSAATKARDVAVRARRIAFNEPTPVYEKNVPATGNTSAANTPADRRQVQALLDMINATVNFDFAGTEPKFGAATDLAINTLCKAMAADKNLKVRVTGHTDDRGTEVGNMRYGQKRAEALKTLMVQRGAPAANISTDSKGQNEPVVDNDTDEHRYQNRRAVITIQ